MTPSSPIGQPRVFISYARADGEAFATALRERLARDEKEITVWQDRAALEGGVGWWKQITDALDIVQFLVLVMTPAAMKSPIAQREWQYARQRGACVYPVMGVPAHDLDFTALPRWMQKAHFFDLTREWSTFVNYLKSPCRAARVPFMAPELAPTFVPRPSTFEPVRRALIERTAASIALTTMLQGAGGLGKTTLAIALCHADDVVEAFDDGVLWVSLGKTPKIADELAKLYVALTGLRPGFIDEEDAAFHLAQVLEDKNCLIVVDDVWEARHLRPFLRGGSGCTRLVTSRIAHAVSGGRRFRVEEMKSAEAVALLGDRLPGAAAVRPRLQELAKRLGEWPLLLELANAQLRRRMDRGDDVDGALDYLNVKLDKRGVVAFDAEKTTERQEAISRTIELSLELLDPPDRAAAARVALFAEDVDIPLEAVQALWDCDDLQAQERCELLDDVSLAKFNAQSATLRFHDVIRAYLTTQLHDVPAEHSRLADLMSGLADAGSAFAWRWRSYHLLQAGRREELRRALRDFTWLAAKLRATDAMSLVSDLEECANDDPDVRLVLEAVKLALPIVAHDPLQFAGQVYARLLVAEPGGGIEAFKGSVEAWRDAAWLQPCSPVLTPAGGPLVATLSGHQRPVLDLCLTPDGRRLVSASADRTVRVWDWMHSRLERVLEGHEGAVRAVVTMGDAVVVSAADDRTIRTWSLDTGDNTGVVDTGTDRVAHVAVLDEAQHRLALVLDNRLAAWRLGETWAPETLVEHRSSIHALARLDDGSILTGGDDRAVCVWEPQGTVHWNRDAHRAPVVAAAGSADGALTVSADGEMRAWPRRLPDLPPRVVTPLAFRTTAVAVTAHGRIVVGADDAALRVLDASSGLLLAQLQGHSGAVNAVRVTGDNRFAISASDDHTIRIWDLARGSAAREPGAHADAVRAIAFSPDGAYAFTTDDFADLIAWSVQSTAPVARVRGANAWIVDVPTGERYVLVTVPGDRLHCWRVEPPSVVLVMRRDGVRAVQVALTDDRRLLFDTDGVLSVWDVARQTRVLHLLLKPGFVEAGCFSSDGIHFAAISPHGDGSVWDLRRGTAVGLPRADRRVITLSPDGTSLAFPDERGDLLMVPLATRDAIVVGEHRDVRSLSFSGDTRRLASCGGDMTLRIWDLKTRGRVASFTFESLPTAAALSPDGSAVVAGNRVGGVHFFRYRPAEPA